MATKMIYTTILLVICLINIYCSPSCHRCWGTTETKEMRSLLIENLFLKCHFGLLLFLIMKYLADFVICLLVKETLFEEIEDMSKAGTVSFGSDLVHSSHTGCMYQRNW